MFTRSIIGGARFLRMPATSRLLYYDLGMAADDDGCVEAFAVMRMTGATEDDLNVLVTKGFVRLLNEDLVAFITDWAANNQIRKDRYHEGRYKELLGCKCEVKLLPDGQSKTNCQPSANQVGDNPATEVRLGKSSIDKGSIGDGKADKPPTPVRQKHGTYGWVRLAEEEYARLVADFGEAETLRCMHRHKHLIPVAPHPAGRFLADLKGHLRRDLTRPKTLDSVVSHHTATVAKAFLNSRHLPIGILLGAADSANKHGVVCLGIVGGIFQRVIEVTV